MVLVWLQARSQNRIARDGPIGIKPGFAGQSMRRENQIKDSHNQNHSHAEPDAHANSRSIVASDSSAVHLVASPHRLNKKERLDRKSTRLNSSHQIISYAVFCLKKKKKNHKL